MSPFEPHGERARWRIVYEDLLSDRDENHVVTYEQLADALDMDAEADRHTIQMAVRRAAKELEEVDKQALDAIPNVGYRIVYALEHMGLARRQQRRSHRALASGKSKVVNVDLTGLEPEARKAFEIMAQAFALQMDFNRRIDVRQKNLEQATKAVTERQARTEEELAELRERLARLETNKD